MILPLVVILVGIVIAKVFQRFKGRNTGSRSQLVAAVNGLLKFPQITTAVVDRRRSLFSKLPKHQQEIGIETLKRYRLARQCVGANSVPINDIVQFAINKYNITSFEIAAAGKISNYQVLETFNHLTRDFCDLTLEQRTNLFSPILARIPKAAGRVCIPGAGVGGLAFEMSKLGWQVDALELDPALYITSEFAQTCSKTYSVFPWALEFSHLAKGQDQTEAGILTFESDSNIKFMYQNFLTHNPTEKYDCVVTLFFIDTAENVLDYLDQIAKILKPGGTWINYGPLKWGSAPRIELSLDELMSIIKTHGWRLESEWKGTNRYSGSPNSMWSAHYSITGWCAKK